MKRISIRHDPVGWSEGVAKTKWRVVIFILLHIIAMSLGVLSIVLSGSVAAGSGFFGLMGVAFPALYLYAIHRLLRVIRKLDERDHKAS